MSVSTSTTIGSWVSSTPPFTDKYGVFQGKYGKIKDPLSGPASGFGILLETSGYILMEDGSFILME